jgi:hypothetical protein
MEKTPQGSMNVPKAITVKVALKLKKNSPAQLELIMIKPKELIVMHAKNVLLAFIVQTKECQIMLKFACIFYSNSFLNVFF